MRRIRDWEAADWNSCGFLAVLWDSKAKRTAGKSGMKGLLLCCLFSALFLFLAPLEVTAQTSDAAAEDTPVVEEVKPDSVVVVMPVKADTEARGREFQDAMTRSVNVLEGYIARSLSLYDHPEYASAFPNAAPDLIYLGNSSYALTSEYYLDTDGRQRFQAWLWESSSGAPIFTDEMVFDEMSEAMDYLPGLVSWIISLIPPDVEPPLTREQVREIVYEILSEMDFSTGTTETVVGIVETTYFHLYTGMWLGGALATYTTQAIGDYSGGRSQGFDGEMAIAVEYRPWRYLGFQAEGLLLVENLNVYRRMTEGASHDEDKYTPFSTSSLSLITPLLVKLPFEVGNIGLRLVLGPYFILPLTQTKDLLESITDREALFTRMLFPFGFSAGIEIGFRLGSWEILGGVRYSRDFTESTGQPNGPYSNLRFNRERLSITLGFRVGFFETGGTKKAVVEDSGAEPVSAPPMPETMGEENALEAPDATAEDDEAAVE